MRVLHLTSLLTILLDFIAWFIIQAVIAIITYLIPQRHFETDRWPYRTRNWERGGQFWQDVFKVKTWKEYLPDGASLIGRGFAKKRLRSAKVDALKLFIIESRRAELSHMLAIPPAFLFFLWNPAEVGCFMIFYAFAINGPCLIAQRYNRPRFQRVLSAKMIGGQEHE